MVWILEGYCVLKLKSGGTQKGSNSMTKFFKKTRISKKTSLVSPLVLCTKTLTYYLSGAGSRHWSMLSSKLGRHLTIIQCIGYCCIYSFLSQNSPKIHFVNIILYVLCYVQGHLTAINLHKILFCIML